MACTVPRPYRSTVRPRNGLSVHLTQPTKDPIHGIAPAPDWERTGPITYVDSWAVPSETTVPETTVSDVTNLAAFFDSFVETYSD